MPSYERGAYEPSDDVHVFDGAEDDEDEEGSRLPLLIVMALLVLAAFGAVVWFAYERGVQSGRTEPQLLTAQQGPAKVAPAGALAQQSPLKGLKIYEQPAPNDEESGPDVSPAASGDEAPTSTRVAAPNPSMSAAAPPARSEAPAPSAGQPKPVQMATPERAPMSAATAPKATTPQPSAASAPKPTPVRTETAALPPVAPATSAPAPSASGAYVLQIGAYKSEAEAQGSWKSFVAKHSALMSGYSPDVKQVDLGDKGTWYRLRVGSFADKNAAAALCEKLKADGGNCFLSR